MIQAVLHRKSQHAESVEDLLTSAIFGRMRYLRPLDGLIPFLESAVLYDLGNTTLGEYLRSNSRNLAEYAEVSYHFWPRHSTRGEPDLALIFKRHHSGLEDFLLLVECKLKSDKSGTGPNDQLKRYYYAIHHERKNFLSLELSSFTGHIGPIVYLTEIGARSEIEDSTKAIEKEIGTLLHPIFHLRWHCLERTLPTNSEPQITHIVEDLKQLVSRMNLVDFSGLTLPAVATLALAITKGPAFFTRSYSNVPAITFFKNLPSIQISRDTFCFYRRH